MSHYGEEPRVWIGGGDWLDELTRFAALVAAEERGRIIAAVEAERRTWHGKYGLYRDVRVDVLNLLLDVLTALPLPESQAQESGEGATTEEAR